MSAGWAGGSTRAWRKFRAQILDRDQHLCQLKLEGCRTRANQVHHLDGVSAGLLCPPDRAVAACYLCNNRTGNPTHNTDPQPNPPRTEW